MYHLVRWGMLKLGKRLLGLLIISATVSVSTEATETIVISSNDSDYRMLKLQGYRGLPRLGVPDSGGLFPLHKGNAQPRLDSDAQRQALAQYQWERKEHVRALWLLVNLRFLQQHPECFSDLTTYQAPVPTCEGLVISPGLQTQFQDYYLEMMATAMTDEMRQSFYCPGGKACAAQTLSSVYVSAGNGKRRPINEFEKRDLFAKVANSQFSRFDRVWPKLKLPTEAYLVSLVDLGDYNFSTNAFNFRLSLHIQLGARDRSGTSRSSTQFNAINQPTYSPQHPFEQELPTEGLLNANVDLPIAASQARQLIDQLGIRRYAYAVTKVRFDSRVPKFPNGMQLVSNIKNGSVPYYLAENKVELFFDEALTQKIGSAPITAHASTTSTPTTQNTSKFYTFKPNSRHFDHRVLHLLRYKEGDLLDADLIRTADSVVFTEKIRWRNVAGREETARRPQIKANNAKQQKRFADQHRRWQNEAKTNNVSWQKLQSFSTNQQQDYYDYLLGYFSKSFASTGWPDSIPSIPWGTNFASIFPRGRFSERREEGAIAADKETTALMQGFLNDVAKSQNIDHLTMVLGIKDIKYDERARRLSARLPIYEMDQVTYLKPNDTHQKGAGLFAHEIAKNRTLYRLAVSNKPIGDQHHEPAFQRCVQNAATQSQDCSTNYKQFMQLQFFHTTLAFDKKLALVPIEMSPERFIKLRDSNKGAGWRMVIEVNQPKMHVAPFKMTDRGRQVENVEAQTVTANIRRVLWLAPNDEIVWQIDGANLVSSVQDQKIVNDSKASSSYSFAEIVSLTDQYNRLDGVVSDTLLAKFVPERLDARMVEAMLSARWAYEQNETKPIGGQFFKTGSRKPDGQDIERLSENYKSWLLQLATILPDQFALTIPVQYAANQFTVASQCVDLFDAQGHAIRNSLQQINLERRALRQCENDNYQINSQIDRCQSAQSSILRLENILETAETKGCLQSETQSAAVNSAPLPNSPTSVSSDLNKLCGIGPDVPLSELPIVMQSCMTKACGTTPTSFDELQNWQACISEVTEQLQTTMTSAISSTRTSSQKTPSSSQGSVPKQIDQCAAPKRELAQARNRFEKNQCHQHLTSSATKDCQAIVAAIKITSVPVETLQFKEPERCVAETLSRGSRLSAILLPGNQPYRDTIVSLAIDVDQLSILYEPPVPKHPLLTNVLINLVVQITEVKTAKTPQGGLVLHGKVMKVDYASR